MHKINIPETSFYPMENQEQPKPVLLYYLGKQLENEYNSLKQQGCPVQAEELLQREANKRRRFIISFLEGVPGCGCGCDDNDKNVGEKTRERRCEFFGTWAQADKQVSDLNSRNDAYVRYGFHIEEVKNA